MAKVSVAIFYKDKEGVPYPYIVHEYSRVPVVNEIVHVSETDNHYLVKSVVHCGNTSQWDAEIYCMELGNKFTNVNVWKMLDENA